jgi:predicted flavoprotein YhiN
MKTYDIIIIGAGASGIFAGARIKNKSVCILDGGDAPLRRVAISGGGKCNFTNTHADHSHYFGKNSDFTRGALARFSAQDM